VRDAEICVGCVRGLLFVPERHVLDAQLVTRVDQRVVRVAALAEHLLDTFLSETFGDEHGSGHAQGSPHVSDDAGRLQAPHLVAVEAKLIDVHLAVVFAQRTTSRSNRAWRA
jgi:hypothetical protein